MNKSDTLKIDFTAFSAWLALSLALAILAFSFGGVDFGVYYAAGKVLLRGGNPYDYAQLIPQIVSSTGTTNNPYYYAPWFTWALAPLALLPFEIARILWAGINFLLWFWGLYNVSRLITWPPIGWRRWGIYLFVTFVFAWSTWGSEQVGVLIFFLLTTALLLLERRKWILAGILLAILLFKPNITAFPVAVLSIWLAYRGNWKTVLSMAASLLFMGAVSLMITPRWYLALFQPDKVTGLSYTLGESGAVHVMRFTTTLLDWLSAYGVIGTPAHAIYAIAAVAGGLVTVWTIAHTRSIYHLMAVAILVNFALVPYALFYDYPPLVLTLFLVNAHLSLDRKYFWIQALMNILVLACLFVGGNIAYRYWMIVLLVISAAVGHIASRGRDATVYFGGDPFTKITASAE